MTSFAELGLSDAALHAVDRLGYENPTPVQEQAIPHAPGRARTCIAARPSTGSPARPAAFLLPALSQLEPRPRGAQG